MNESNKEFLSWLRDRLINVYGESPGTDFVQKIAKIVESEAPPEWTTEAPNSTGHYWFFGEGLMGEMGCDYYPDRIHKPCLQLVKVVQASNGLIAITEGHFMQLKKFDVQKQHSRGYLGYWKPADMPDIPEDVEKCFRI